MKKICFALIVLMILAVTGDVFADITIEILDQDTPTVVQNGEYGPILDVQITATDTSCVQSRCFSFSISNGFSWLLDLRFEDLQWKEVASGWESLSKVDSEWDLTIPCWFCCNFDETLIISLWGRVISNDVTQGQGEIEIGWYSADYLWLSGNPEIENNFPQHKSIIIMGNTSVNDNINNPNQIQNYPNPFNPVTMISFNIAKPADVELVIFNSKGQKVKTLISNQLSAGSHSIIWNGTNQYGKPVASGVYFYKFKSGQHDELTRKMILMK